MKPNVRLQNIRRRALQRYSHTDLLTDEEKEIRQACLDSYGYFVRYFWRFMVPDPFMPNWHVDALVEHMEALFTGDITKLIVNYPPRSSKTTLCSIAFQPWTWLNWPEARFIYGSHTLKLSSDLGLKSRELIETPEFKKLFGDIFYLSKDNSSKTYFTNNKLGGRLCVSVKSTVIGFGGDFVFADDPNSPEQVHSVSERERALSWWSHAASTRLNDEENSRRIIVQQRLHEKDLTGHWLSSQDKDIVHLFVPMEFESHKKCTTTFGDKKWEDPRTKDGEIMWAEKFTPESLAKKRIEMGSLEYTGQYQQSPYPEGGLIYKKEWFRYWKNPTPPDCHTVIQSWDTALTGIDTRLKSSSEPCYSACTTWGIFEDDYGAENIILLNSWRGKVEYPELRKIALRLSHNYHDTVLEQAPIKARMAPDIVLIEAKVNGFSLYQELLRSGVNAKKFNIKKYNNKYARAHQASVLVEGGRVWMPAAAPSYSKPLPFADEMIQCCIKFPSSDSNDMVDSMSQALLYMRDRLWIPLEDDRIIELPEMGYREPIQI
jgi:hypothetical protein